MSLITCESVILSWHYISVASVESELHLSSIIHGLTGAREKMVQNLASRGVR